MCGVRIAVLGAFLVLVGTGCEKDQPSAKPAVPWSELVKAGAVWDPPADPLVISLAADGTLSLLGHEVGLEELRADLRAKARDPRLRNVDGTSKIDAVLRVAPSLPWTIVQWVMQVCADPNVQIYRVHFAVMPEAGGEEGVIPTFLPRDRGIGGSLIVEEWRVQATMSAAEGTTDRALIFAALKAALAATKDRTLQIDTPPPHVPRAGNVLTLVDLAYRAGAESVQFSGDGYWFPKKKREPGSAAPESAATAGSVAWLRAWVAKTSKEVPAGANVRIRIGAEAATGPRDAPLPPLPPPPPRHVRPAPGSQSPWPDEPPLYEDVPPDVELPPTAEEEPPAAKPPADEGRPPFEPAERRPNLFRARADRLSGKSAIAADPKADAAIERALAWLAAHQSADGGWEAAGFGGWCDGKRLDIGGPDGQGKAQYDVGVTGLALLSFLGAGYTNRSEGPYGKVVASGLRYLRNVQDAEGCFGPRSSGHYNYGHAIAALAMVEAYGMSQSAIYKASAQKGLEFVEISRNPYFAWRYGVKPGDNDTSVTGWMALALHAAAFVNAAASETTSLRNLDEDALAGASAWIDKMTDAQTGRVGYQQRGTGPARPAELVDAFPAEKSESMTAIGVLLRVLAGESPATSDPVKRGVKLMTALPPVWNARDGSIDLYYWQAGALAMAQVGGADAEAWRAALSKALVESQRTEGENCGVKGSWDPIDPWGSDGGRVYMTAMAALALEAPYRYPRAAGAAKK